MKQANLAVHVVRAFDLTLTPSSDHSDREADKNILPMLKQASMRMSTRFT